MGTTFKPLYSSRLYTCRELAFIAKEEYGLDATPRQISRRLQHGWTVKDAISKPFRRAAYYTSYYYHGQKLADRAVLALAQQQAQKGGLMDDELVGLVFSINLQYEIERRHLLRTKIAQAARVSDSHLAAMLAGRRVPQTVTLYRLTHTLGIGMDDLVDPWYINRTHNQRDFA